MDSNNWLTLLVAAALMVSLFQAIQLNSLSAQLQPGTGAASLSAAIGGETVEQMNARMHPDLAGTAPSSASGSTAGTTMVGGC